MKKHLLLVLSLLLVASTMFAVPARRDWQTKTTPDGTTITVRQVGDEFYHFWETTDGKIARMQSDGTFVVTDEARPSSEQMSQRRQASKKYQSRQIRKIGASSMPARALFILVSFSNQTFKDASATYYKTKLGDSSDGAMSMYNYLKLQSNGAYAPPVDVFGPVNVNKTYATYGANNYYGDDVNPAQMIVDACKGLDSEIDFSQYDANNDGIVDNVYVIYAGKGEADGGNENTIWPHQWDLTSAGLSLTLDGKKIISYACSAELNGNSKCAMGTPLHEFGHVIGLPDYYDTEYASTNYSEARTPGEWSIMDGGSYNNDGNTPPNYSIYDKYYLGWLTPKFLAKDGEGQNITLTTDWGDGYQIAGKTSLQAATNTSTIYYIENRQKTGWDEYLPGHGMIVWQVKYNSTNWNNNDLNNTGGSPRYTVYSASGDPTNIGKASDPFPGSKVVRTFDAVTGSKLEEITETGGNITFKYNGGLQKTECSYEFEGDNCSPTSKIGVVSTGTALSLTIWPATGYTLADASCWMVEMGLNNDLVYGEGFTYDAATGEFRIESVTDDVTIIAEGKKEFSIQWFANSSLFATTTSAGMVAFPSGTPEACEDGKTFVGWSKVADYEDASSAPDFVEAGDAVSEGDKFYAVYAEVTSGGTTGWNLVTDDSSLKAGDVLVMACSSKGATAGDISSQIMGTVESTFGDGVISSLGSGTVELTLGGSEGAWTLTSSKGLLGATAVKKVAWGSGTTTWSISIASGDATIQNGTESYGRFLYNATNPRFTTYSSNPTAAMLLPQLYRKTAGTSYANFTTSCGVVVTCTLDKIELNTTAVKTDFLTTDEFSYEGLVVTAKYKEVECEPEEVTPTSVVVASMEEGMQTVTVTYEDKTATYTIGVTKPVTYTVKWHSCEGVKEVVYVENAILAFPDTPADNDGKAFYGWTETEHYTGKEAPAILDMDEENKVKADADYYAVYK